MPRELLLRGHAGQLSHEGVDQHLLEVSLRGRTVDRTLGSFASSQVSGTNYLLDDDSVFSLRHVVIDDFQDTPASESVKQSEATQHEVLF